MSTEQWRRLDIVGRIERGEMTIAEGAVSLGLSRRQMKRIRKRIRAEGEGGVVHGNAGRSPKHKTSALIRDRVVALRLRSTWASTTSTSRRSCTSSSNSTSRGRACDVGSEPQESARLAGVVRRDIVAVVTVARRLDR